MAITYDALSTVVVGSGGVTSIDFTSIPQTYTDLLIMLSSRTDGSGNFNVQLNNTTSGYSQVRLGGTGSGTYSNTSTGQSGNSGNSFLAGISGGSSNTSNVFGNAYIYVNNYTSSNNKTLEADSNQENNSTASYSELFAGVWSNTAAVTSVKLLTYDTGGKFVQYTTATLYGIKKS